MSPNKPQWTKGPTGAVRGSWYRRIRGKTGTSSLRKQLNTNDLAACQAGWPRRKLDYVQLNATGCVLSLLAVKLEGVKIDVKPEAETRQKNRTLKKQRVRTTTPEKSRRNRSPQ